MDEAIEDLKIQRPLRDEARKTRGLVVPIPFNQVQEYHTCIRNCVEDLKHAPSPAMPLASGTSQHHSSSDSSMGCKVHLANVRQQHRQKVLDSAFGYPMPELATCGVHKQLQPCEWRKFEGGTNWTPSMLGTTALSAVFIPSKPKSGRPAKRSTLDASSR